MRDQRANNLPYGMQRRLEIARALAVRPQIILLDEPAAGMNEEESAQLSEFIRTIRDTKEITVVIIDHHMDVIMSICDKISVLNFGTLLAAGKPWEIQNNPEVISAYLGVDE
jgi:branched-chain amino acid transport system ATP-binding protein